MCGGGVMALLLNTLSHHMFCSRNFSPYCQCLVLSINSEQQTIYFILFYRSPACEALRFHEALTYISSILEDSPSCIILGDMNFPTIDWFSTGESCRLYGSAREFYHFCNEHALTQLVTIPTLGNNILDVVLSNNLDIVHDVNTLAPFSTSDHRAVSFQLRLHGAEHTLNDSYYDFFAADYFNL